MRSLQTELPLCSERSSGSWVRLPVITTTLMFVAATRGLLSLTLSKLGSPSLDRGSEVSPARVADWGCFLTEATRSRRRVRGLALDALALGTPVALVDLGRADDRRREIGRRRSAGAKLGDAEAQYAVGDLEAVVELLEQLHGAVELEQVVVGIGALAHLEGGRPHAPV